MASNAQAHGGRLLLPVYVQIAIAILEFLWHLFRICLVVASWLLQHHIVIYKRIRQVLISMGGEPIVQLAESVVEGVVNHPLVVATLSWSLSVLLWVAKLLIEILVGFPLPQHIETEVAEQFEGLTANIPDPYQQQLRDTQIQVKQLRERHTSDPIS